ncbi:hypothetical protein [Fischerella sp. PCC 9605]|nr:hypothetical protein [Fischerella sp. PCC 9605]
MGNQGEKLCPGQDWVLFTGDRGLGKNPVKFSRLLPNTQYTVQQRRSFRR